MSLKQRIIWVSVLLSTLTMVVAFSLVVFTTRLESASSRSIIAVESVRAAEELQIELLKLHRSVFRFEVSSAQADLRTAQNQAAEVERWLEASRKFVEGKEEIALFNELEKHVHGFLSARKSEVGEPDAEARYIQTSERLRDSLDAAQKLTEYNLREAHVLREIAEADDRFADVLAGVTGSLTVALMISLWFGVRNWIYVPVRDLQNMIRGFSHNKTLTAKLGNESPTEFQAIADSFSELTKLLAEQREAQLRFLASVAHDLRNPLNAIRMSAEILESDSNISADDRSIVSIMSRQATHLDRMVGDLLDATRIEAGHLDLHKDCHDLRRMVFDAVALHQSLSRVHKVEVHSSRDFDPSRIIPIDCDPVRISQVLNNLLNNAIKYSPNGGTVGVKIEKEGNSFVTVEISDPGIGISGDDLTKIFEPFRRTDSTRTTIPGVGLGLSVTKKIIEMHGGSITVQSQLGQGAKFMIRLPLMPEILTQPLMNA